MYYCLQVISLVLLEAEILSNLLEMNCNSYIYLRLDLKSTQVFILCWKLCILIILENNVYSFGSFCQQEVDVLKLNIYILKYFPHISGISFLKFSSKYIFTWVSISEKVN
jgi:hypothetical protein